MTAYVIQILSQPSQLSFSYAAEAAEDSVKGMGFPEYVCVRGLYSVSSYRSEKVKIDSSGS